MVKQSKIVTKICPPHENLSIPKTLIDQWCILKLPVIEEIIPLTENLFLTEGALSEN